MKKLKLFGLLGLLAMPITFLAGQNFNQENEITTIVNKANAIPNTIKNAPKAEHPFKVGENYYDTLADAVTNCPDKGEIQMLDDYEMDHERTTNVDLPVQNITNSLTLNGLDDEGTQHSIKGVRYEITGTTGTPVTVDFNSVTIIGDKAYNAPVSDGRNKGNPFFNITNANVNFNGTTKITDYKYWNYSVISLHNSTVNINDRTEITDLAAKFGIFRYDENVRSSVINMSGGSIHDCLSSNISGDKYREGVLFYLKASTTQGNAVLNITGGKIYNNKANCWSDMTQCNSPGLLYLHSNSGKIVINFENCRINDNVTTKGGVLYNSGAETEITIGGGAYLYDNYGYDKDKGELFDSNIFINNTVKKQDIKINPEHPLTKEAKVGILLHDGLLPAPGEKVPVVSNAKYDDRTHFIADNEDYTMRFTEANKTLDIYKYQENEPHLTEPIFNDDLHYNDQDQQLMLSPGKVTKGGTLLYSLDYKGDREEAHWTDDPTKVTGKSTGDYTVTYYVAEGGGCIESDYFYATVHIGKRLMDIIWSEDNYTYNGKEQKITAKYIKEGRDINLDFTLALESNPEKTGVKFKDVTASPDDRYIATATEPEHEEDLDFPKEPIKYYTMRISEEQYIEEGKIEIEPDPKTKKPSVLIESDIGFNAWTTLTGKKLDEETHKEEYEAAVNDLNTANKITSNDSLEGIYDVTMLAHLKSEEGEEVVQIVRNLDGSLKISLLLPEGISKGSNISIYRIHENDDGSKVVDKLAHRFDKDGYVSITTDKLSAFAIVKHKTNLLWLIITLGGVNLVLVGGIVFTIVYKKKPIKKKVARGKK